MEAGDLLWQPLNGLGGRKTWDLHVLRVLVRLHIKLKTRLSYSNSQMLYRRSTHGVIVLSFRGTFLCQNICKRIKGVGNIFWHHWRTHPLWPSSGF